MIAMGRRLKDNHRGVLPGEQHPRHKLTWDDVGKIRELSTSSMTYREIGEVFGVSPDNIRAICLNMTWITPGMKRVPPGQRGMMLDKSRKRGSPGGERQGSHKLTWKEVEVIRGMRRDTGLTFAEIAKQFGVATGTIRDVCNLYTWVPDGMRRKACPQNGSRGERHWKAKMTEEDVRELRRQHAAGNYKSIRELGFRFGITAQNATAIITGKTWKGV